MPPGLVFLNYFVFLIFGNGYTGFFVLTGIKITAYTLSAFMAIKFLGIEKDRKNLVFFLLLFFLYLAFSANENFGMIIDLWLIVFLQTAFLYALNFYDKTRSWKYIFWLIILMFFMPLVSPGISLASVVLVLLYALCNILRIFKSIPGHSPVSTCLRAVFVFAPRRWSLIPFFLMGVSFMLSISLWTYRNYRVFDEIIPTKSNLPFEFYLSNVK